MMIDEHSEFTRTNSDEIASSLPVLATIVKDDTIGDASAARDEAKISRPSAAPSMRRLALLNTFVFLGLALSHSDMCTQAAAAAPVQATQQQQQQRQQVHTSASNTQELENVVPDYSVPHGLFQQKEDHFGRLVETRNQQKQDGASASDYEEVVYDSDSESESHFDTKKDIFIVTAVDGTLAGIDSQTGHVLWKRAGGGSRDMYKRGESDSHCRDNESMKLPRSRPETREGSLLEPLLATTTTARSSKKSTPTDASKTVAIPSVDGNVYLTTIGSARGNSPPGATATVTASVRELVSRAPFVDTTGRFYVGARSTTVAALDGDTGEILQVAAADADHDNNLNQMKPNDPSWQDRNVVWIGRADFSVSVYNARTSAKEAQFAASEVMGVNDMVVGNVASTSTPSYSQYQDMFVSERAPNLMFASNSDSDVHDATNTDVEAKDTPRFAQLVTTPNGNLAFRDPDTGNVAWVADQPFDTPISFAIQSSTGRSMAVDIIPDVPIPSQSMEYLRYEMERQIEVTMNDDRPHHDTSDLGVDDEAGTSGGNEYNNWRSDEVKVQMQPPVMGALLSGELYAMPLGSRRDTHTHNSNGLSTMHRHSQASSTSSASLSTKHSLSKVPLIAGRFPGHHLDGKQGHGPTNAICGPSTPTFPSCLFKGVLQRLELPQTNNAQPVPGSSIATVDKPLRRDNTHDIDGVVGSLEYHPDYRHGPSDSDRWNQEQQQRQRKQRKLLRILGSWLPPTIALIFVVSFELGRRKRQKDAGLQSPEGNIVDNSDLLRSADDKALPAADTGVREVIQVTDQVLGYGGHGTVVFRGMLEGRNVAVKRMLKTYLASADREISLLIESDGHPNVVRYFLKEVRGDFVYLALELCDVSLQNLIGTLCGIRQEPGNENAFSVLDQSALPAAKEIVLQIATGVRHLHSLRIVHRDLKPPNILLAVRKKSKSPGTENSAESVYDNFLMGNYTAKISDMGLGKMLAGQSSFGGSTLADPSFRGQSNGGIANGTASIGPGTTGWQAPECMAIRQTSRNNHSSDMSHSGDASPLESSSSSSRSVSRSSDIFSLGCIFFSVLVPGSHPFGEWYEREANIMHNRPCIDKLQALSVEAYDLVLAMIQRSPRNRPTAKQICDHPFFWNMQRKLAFICDLSDRLETDTTASGDESAAKSSFAQSPLAIERYATSIVGTAWDKALYEDLVSNVQRFRAYDPCSIRDLLRLIRNKHHHYDELPLEVRQKVGSNTDGLMQYFQRCFPKLLLHCYEVCGVLLHADDPLVRKYAISIHYTKAPKQAQKVLAQPNTLSSTTESDSSRIAVKDPPSPKQVSFDSQDLPVSVSTATNTPHSDPVSDSLIGDPDAGFLPAKEDVGIVNPAVEPDEHEAKTGSETQAVESDESHNGPQQSPHSDATDLATDTNTDDIIIWQGSTAAKKFNSRGWIRSDEDWARRAVGGRKRNANLIRCADDSKFRTRLCNHWDESFGTFCPMRRKNKCVFAHGPVELRVKEGKRHRWAKLVDKNGDSTNLNHSGGEDTYGAARSIESTRKEEGKWSTKSQSRSKKPHSNQKKKKAQA